MIGSMIRSDRAMLKNNVLFRNRNARKVKKREETRARATSVVSQKLRRRRHQVETVIEKSSLWFKYIWFSVCRRLVKEQIEKNCWRKRKERERECAPVLLRRNRRRRDLTVSCLKCVCVCCACEFSEESQTFRIISNERRRKSGRYFLSVCTFKIWSKKKNFIFFQKAH